MQLSFNSSVLSYEAHLSYCTNIHAGESWFAVETQLRDALPKLKARLSPNGRFGIGLRLSYLAACQLSETKNLVNFKAFLFEHDLYVYTINGFPYGKFHQTRVKEAVYLPDWRDQKRVTYSCILADLLCQLLPADLNYGSISTVPGAYKLALNSERDIEVMRHNLILVVAHLVKLEQKYDTQIQLALEPEPCCFLETIQESVDFFQQQVFHSVSCKQLSQILDCSHSQAETLIHRHLGICLDTCHAAVEFESPDMVVNSLRRAGIEVAKIQLSNALRIVEVNKQTVLLLQQYADSVYLHQVVELCDDDYYRYQDLPEALMTLGSNARKQREWRIHFHVPIFKSQMQQFDTTQYFLISLLNIYKQNPFSHHLEVETYSWNMLPKIYRQHDVCENIARELCWVLEKI